jgi:hypothetical protein
MLALIIPRIEVILALVGSTAGSLICYILPSVLYMYSHESSFKAKVYRCEELLYHCALLKNEALIFPCEKSHVCSLFALCDVLPQAHSLPI